MSLRLSGFIERKSMAAAQQDVPFSPRSPRSHCNYQRSFTWLHSCWPDLHKLPEELCQPREEPSRMLQGDRLQARQALSLWQLANIFYWDEASRPSVQFFSLAECVRACLCVCVCGSCGCPKLNWSVLDVCYVTTMRYFVLPFSFHAFEIHLIHHCAQTVIHTNSHKHTHTKTYTWIHIPTFRQTSR